MATIDLIVLGMLKNESLSAYDIQKLIEYRNISDWVKISTPSIYKKVIQLKKKGLIESTTVQGENKADKVIYSITEEGKTVWKELMDEISRKPIHFFLDFNAVIVNLQNLDYVEQKNYLQQMEMGIEELKRELLTSYEEKKNLDEIPKTGLAVLKQQMILADAISSWIHEASFC